VHRLILEASTPTVTWVLAQDQKVLRSGTLTGTVASSLIPSLQKNLPLSSPADQILVGVGPGSFSGIRAAIASAQGIAASWSCPVLPIRSTHAIAQEFPEVTHLGIFSDARRGDFFATFYDHGKLSRPTTVHPISHLPKLLSRCTLAVTSDGLADIPKIAHPSALHLLASLVSSPLEPDLPLAPLHLRPAVAPSRTPLF
jgi:tRNA threonylcarbamoyl adenosine modification protein YeaZ